MGFLAGVGRAAGVLLPGAALDGRKLRDGVHGQHSQNIPPLLSRPCSP
jgi:hypothetical protein